MALRLFRFFFLLRRFFFDFRFPRVAEVEAPFIGIHEIVLLQFVAFFFLVLVLVAVTQPTVLMSVFMFVMCMTKVMI